jgi:regulator of protease activity HflC (stomatin/prohibitin superfamily)
MLTGDENIVDINFVVFWRIKDAQKYLFNIQKPDVTGRWAHRAREATIAEPVRD